MRTDVGKREEDSVSLSDRCSYFTDWLEPELRKWYIETYLQDYKVPEVGNETS